MEMMTKEEIAQDFEEDVAIFDNCDIIYAEYNHEGYEGDCFVLFKKDGKMYWNFGSHCSCYGLEGQWDPEEVTVEEIKFRIDNGSDYGVFGHARGFLKEYFNL